MEVRCSVPGLDHPLLQRGRVGRDPGQEHLPSVPSEESVLGPRDVLPRSGGAATRRVGRKDREGTTLPPATEDRPPKRQRRSRATGRASNKDAAPEPAMTLGDFERDRGYSSVTRTYS